MSTLPPRKRPLIKGSSTSVHNPMPDTRPLSVAPEAAPFPPLESTRPDPLHAPLTALDAPGSSAAPARPAGDALPPGRRGHPRLHAPNPSPDGTGALASPTGGLAAAPGRAPSPASPAGPAAARAGTGSRKRSWLDITGEDDAATLDPLAPLRRPDGLTRHGVVAIISLADALLSAIHSRTIYPDLDTLMRTFHDPWAASSTEAAWGLVRALAASDRAPRPCPAWDFLSALQIGRASCRERVSSPV